MSANIAGAISPLVFRVLAQDNRWGLPLIISAVILVVGVNRLGEFAAFALRVKRVRRSQRKRSEALLTE